MKHANGSSREFTTEELNKALRADPGNVDILTLRGNLYLQRGQVQEAIEDYDRVLETFPDHVEAYVHRARARLEVRDMEGVMQDLEQAFSLRPDLDEGCNPFGLSEEMRLSLNEAVQSCTVEIKNNVGELGPYWKRGIFALMAGDVRQGIADLKLVRDLLGSPRDRF